MVPKRRVPGVDVVEVLVAGLVGLLIGSALNRLIVREPGYVVTDPRDLPEGADESLLDELEVVDALGRVPVLAILRPGTWWRRWFPVTEVVTAGLFGLTVARLGVGTFTVAVLFLVAALVTLGAVDFRVYRIPDRINFPAMITGFALIAAVSIERGLPEAIIGAVVGGVSYATIMFLAHIAYPRGMGWGDVKLSWIMGFYLGWVGFETGPWINQLIGPLRFVLFGAALGSLFGVLIGGGYAVVKRSTKVVFPYGPSLALGCITVVLFASELR